MSEVTPHLAPIVVLMFLGSIFVVAIFLLVLLYGAARWSASIAGVGAGAISLVVGAYIILLCGASFASSEKVLPPGGWKYFCEIDCHIGYSVLGMRTAAFGAELQQRSARGQFVLVRVETWFDQRTISPHRGDGPLTPNRRRVFLVDDKSNYYDPLNPDSAPLPGPSAASTPLTQPLRPGESYVTDFAFDVPNDGRGLRLLIIENDPETRFLIGHENSPFHKKIYLGLESAPTLTSAAAQSQFVR